MNDYKTPPIRERERRNQHLNEGKKIIADADLSAFDPTADKYDYLIVFNHEKKSKVDIKWEKIDELWFQSIPGEDTKKKSGVSKLREEWNRRFGNVDMVNKALFDSLVREHVIEALSRKSLQLKLSLAPNGKLLYCQIRAPISLLERKADILKYNLKFKDEVDPGVDFWTDDELVEEARLYNRATAEELLEEFYAKGKISPNDMAILPEETMSKQWSRRIHTLERIMDGVPCTNPYPAYAAYDTDRKSRHLYEEYLSVRSTTLFLPKDRLYLTKHIIDEVFDFEVLAEHSIVEFITALHDANYGEMPTTAWLRKRWVFFWNAEVDRIGGPYLSHPATNKNNKCPLRLYPWAQPLMEIRAYFGEKIALYFAWLGFYGYYLLIPAMLGLLCTAYVIVFGSDESKGVHYEQYVFAALIACWTALYKEHWDVESQYCAIKWGTLNFEEEEADRPKFVGDKDTPRRISPITNQNETYYPVWKRARSQRFSMIVVVLFIVTLVAAILFIFALAALVPAISSLLSIGQAVMIQIMSTIYGKVATAMNEAENYRTQTAYENNLILKKFLFEIFNNYSALAITAFFKGSLFGCVSGANGGNCLGDVKSLLISIMGTRFVLAIMSTLSRQIASVVKMISPQPQHENTENTESLENEEDSEDEAEEPAVAEAPRFESELSLECYEGTFDDYAEIVLQMGLVSMFSLCWYMVPCLAVLEVLLQLRVDAYKLTTLTRRPDPMPAETVGSWGVLMESMGILAVYANSGIIVFTTKSFTGFNMTEKLIVFFVLEQAILLMKMTTHFVVDDEPTPLIEIKKRQKFVVDRHKHAIFVGDSEPFDDTDITKARGAVDADALSVMKMRQYKPNKIVRERLEYLRRRLLKTDLEIQKSRRELELASSLEIWREELGVSYSKKTPTLALGMLTITIVEAINVGSLSEPVDHANVRVVVQVEDISQGTEPLYQGPVAPPAVVTRPARKPRSSQGDVGVKLTFGHCVQLAPIKSADATCSLDIVDDANKRRIGHATLPLSALLDQRLHERVSLPVEKPQGGTASILISAQFQYSKITPIKERTVQLLDEQKRLHRDITNLQLGAEDLENDWDFPDLRNVEGEKSDSSDSDA